VIDDHPIFRNALHELLAEHGIPVVGQAADGEQGVALVEKLAPDLAVMDISMPGISGIEATRRIRASCPATRVLVLTVSPDSETVTEAVAAGACGYLLKDAEPDDLVMGIRFASVGGSLLSAPVAEGLLERVSSPPEPAIPEEVRTRLTERELEVLRLLAQGKENAEIAEDLVISPQTVKNHVSSLLAKLEVENRLQAAVAAVRGGLV
jgi:DNA-binding NarL/FixJ family response regulator